MNISAPLSIFFSASILVGVVFLGQTAATGTRDTDRLKNIHGIEYYDNAEVIRVTEELAHTSLELKEPSLAKELHLTIRFNPREVKKLYVGARKTPFWLSYDWQQFYDTTDAPEDEIITTTVSIPLSDVLQNPNRSVDLMFRAETSGTVWWELHTMETEVGWVMPSRWELREYLKHVIKQERPL